MLSENNGWPSQSFAINPDDGAEDVDKSLAFDTKHGVFTSYAPGESTVISVPSVCLGGKASEKGSLKERFTL